MPFNNVRVYVSLFVPLLFCLLERVSAFSKVGGDNCWIQDSGTLNCFDDDDISTIISPAAPTCYDITCIRTSLCGSGKAGVAGTPSEPDSPLKTDQNSIRGFTVLGVEKADILVDFPSNLMPTLKSQWTETSHNDLLHAMTQQKHALELPGTQMYPNQSQPPAEICSLLLSLFKLSDDRTMQPIPPATQQPLCKSSSQSFLAVSVSSSSLPPIDSKNSPPATQNKIEPLGARSSSGFRGPSVVGNSGICSARKEMQGSCLGMVVGLVVGIMWF